MIEEVVTNENYFFIKNGIFKINQNRAVDPSLKYK